MKLMHIADLHLDAKMETGLTSTRARERRVELLLTFSRAIDEAVSLGVDAVLLAGDLFDTARVSEKTRRYVGDIVCDHPSFTGSSFRAIIDSDDIPRITGKTACFDLKPQKVFLFRKDTGARIRCTLGE